MNPFDLEKKFKITHRTSIRYPILDSAPIFEISKDNWTSSEYIRFITYSITGFHTFHATDNLVILREFLNQTRLVGRKPFIESTLANGKGNFYTVNRKTKFSFDFQKKKNPTAEKFMESFKGFLNTNRR